jgi:hypothetical protein
MFLLNLRKILKNLQINFNYIFTAKKKTKEEQIYKYDNINRLKSTVYQDSGGPPSLKYEYTYDAVGNRIYKVETNFESPDTNEYTYNYNTNNNRLTGITETGETFIYNNRGDLLTAIGGYTFSYDREGRLDESSLEIARPVEQKKMLGGQTIPRGKRGHSKKQNSQ